MVDRGSRSNSVLLFFLCWFGGWIGIQLQQRDLDIDRHRFSGIIGPDLLVQNARMGQTSNAVAQCPGLADGGVSYFFDCDNDKWSKKMELKTSLIDDCTIDDCGIDDCGMQEVRCGDVRCTMRDVRYEFYNGQWMIFKLKVRKQYR